MQQADVLIIGAGAAGLMAAMQLSRKGKIVIVLEARDRVGGRVNTVTDGDLPNGSELGAEFVHGQLPVTLALLKEAKIEYTNAVGDMWRYADGKFKKSEQFLIHYDLIIKKMNALKEDITLDEFLTTHFAAKKYQETCTMLRNFAAGYDTADPALFSTFAMRAELQSEDDGHQYRVKGGYTVLITYLQERLIGYGGSIHLSTIVKKIVWEKGKVVAVSSDERRFIAAKAIITIPLGVLQAGKTDTGAITFDPAIPKKEHAIQQMGMGIVIKLLFQFDEIFWYEQAIKKGAGDGVKQLSYLFSDEAIPTWWTQTPHQTPLLTGWIGGPPAAALKSETDEHIMELGLQSLSNIYDLPIATLRRKLKTYKIANWPTDPFTRGAYSYATVATKAARKILAKPEQKTLHFAGEALYDGPEMGTVEAALASGKAVAHQIFNE